MTVFQDSDIKGELGEIDIKRKSSAFMKHLSRTIGEGAEEPTVDDHGINNDPIRSSYLSSYDEATEGAKHVAFSDEDEDQAHVDSAGTFLNFRSSKPPQIFASFGFV